MPGSFKNLFADNGFVVVCYVVFIYFTIVCMSVEGIVSIGFLENDIACVFFICKNASDAR